MNFANFDLPKPEVEAVDAASAASGISSESSMDLVEVLPVPSPRPPIPPIQVDTDIAPLDNIVLPILKLRSPCHRPNELTDLSGLSTPRRPKAQMPAQPASLSLPREAPQANPSPTHKASTPLSDRGLRRSLRLKIKSMGFKRRTSSAEASKSIPDLPTITDFISISRSASVYPALTIPQIQHSDTFLCGIHASMVTDSALILSDSDDPARASASGAPAGVSSPARDPQAS
ncbi:hypothetical protein GUJ93_ZPchr0007g3834 [Zizania palustris]|uniref:Uncharacterized protein n=1 Tax=Zizania palustris TaxID=103762 RepID=A0A8J5TJY0_ZIZPA|nr:hypothetical protein GUJ93_ZPchr0007g3834 [Zizania palustris]